MIKTVESKVFGKLNIEFYNSANAIADDLTVRTKTDTRFKQNEYDNPVWVGATREQTYKMLREGYQPTVDALKAGTRINLAGSGKRIRFANSVEGFAPIVPNAIMGLPNSMITTRIKPIKTKVLDIYYESTCSGCMSSSQLIEAGQKLLGAVLELEAQGYRFNLYTIQGYYGQTATDHVKSCDMLCLRVKSANQPFDLKRMSFPATHSAFFRGIGFEWYSKFPLGKYRYSYGHPVSNDYDQKTISAEFKRLFGQSAVYVSAQSLIKVDREYLKEVLTNDKA